MVARRVKKSKQEPDYLYECEVPDDRISPHNQQKRSISLVRKPAKTSGGSNNFSTRYSANDTLHRQRGSSEVYETQTFYRRTQRIEHRCHYIRQLVVFSFPFLHFFRVATVDFSHVATLHSSIFIARATSAPYN